MRISITGAILLKYYSFRMYTFFLNTAFLWKPQQSATLLQKNPLGNNYSASRNALLNDFWRFSCNNNNKKFYKKGPKKGNTFSMSWVPSTVLLLSNLKLVKLQRWFSPFWGSTYLENKKSVILSKDLRRIMAILFHY